MGDFMINKVFKKAVGAATLVATLACLMPDAAQAQRVRFAGRSMNQSQIDFDLDTTVDETDPGLGNDELGYFLEAIQNFSIEPPDGSETFTNSSICGSNLCPNGNLTVSRLTDENVSNLVIGGSPGTRENLQMAFENFISNPNSRIDFSQNNIFRYDVSFSRGGSVPPSTPSLVWFVQSSDNSFFNDLSRLDQIRTIPGLVFATDDNGNISSDLFNLDVSQSIPESNTTTSLLALGTLGAFAVYKRYQRLKHLT